MAEKNLDLDTFKETFRNDYDNWKGNFRVKDFHPLLDQENFKSDVKRRTDLRIALKNEGFFEAKGAYSRLPPKLQILWRRSIEIDSITSMLIDLF
jgi:hypothetical protein